ncbi:hypothetical protein R3P38DRAFT_3169527 [Favolaschia claudopus]|uniref:Uncharacterized protein n=1 Tax=Favolaschia claudopus TaxID=2862362 RepID=A0AAW0E2G2_9AGAR
MALYLTQNFRRSIRYPNFRPKIALYDKAVTVVHTSVALTPCRNHSPHHHYDSRASALTTSLQLPAHSSRHSLVVELPLAASTLRTRPLTTPPPHPLTLLGKRCFSFPSHPPPQPPASSTDTLALDSEPTGRPLPSLNPIPHHILLLRSRLYHPAAPPPRSPPPPLTKPPPRRTCLQISKYKVCPPLTPPFGAFLTTSAFPLARLVPPLTRARRPAPFRLPDHRHLTDLVVPTRFAVFPLSRHPQTETHRLLFDSFPLCHATPTPQPLPSLTPVQRRVGAPRADSLESALESNSKKGRDREDGWSLHPRAATDVAAALLNDIITSGLAR